ncbi:MAG: CsgG/HfaB family protein, partial [Spirochaetaceae bacterium]|nr:CsgG/HfaB family protein [Spirochaetaceae bacterium]
MKIGRGVWCVLLGGSFALTSLLAQDRAIALDRAIQESHVKIERELSQGTKIIVLNFDAPQDLADYVIDQLIAKLVNNKKLIVVERKDLNLINTEMTYQLSGEVSDEEAQVIGKKYGAQAIASGKV